MKSAYELAMERSGVLPLKSLTEEQKSKISELEALHKAKRVEAEISADNRLAKALTKGEVDQIRDDLAVELASINSRLEREKEKVRNT